ncbi:MAG: hypothetical protein ABGZ17_23300, partial [Planctomycetaceae bacterium]
AGPDAVRGWAVRLRRERVTRAGNGGKLQPSAGRVCGRCCGFCDGDEPLSDWAMGGESVIEISGFRTSKPKIGRRFGPFLEWEPAGQVRSASQLRRDAAVEPIHSNNLTSNHGVMSMSHRTVQTWMVAGVMGLVFWGELAADVRADAFPNRRARTYGFGYVVSSPWNSSSSPSGRYGHHTPGYRIYRTSMGQASRGSHAMGTLRRATYLGVPAPPRGLRLRFHWGGTLPRSALRTGARR